MQRPDRFPIPGSRELLAACALCCFACAFVLAPSGVRSQLAAPVRASDAGAVQRPPAAASAIPVEGDAFAPRSAADDDPTPAPAHVAGAILQPSARVTAIVTGARPTALVEIGPSVRAVSVGDVLGGSRVAFITDDAVELSNGERLSLIPAAAVP